LFDTTFLTSRRLELQKIAARKSTRSRAAKQGALQRRSRSHAQKPAGEEGNRRRTRAEQKNGEGFEVTREGPTTDDPRSSNPGAQNQLLKSDGKPTGTRSEKKRKRIPKKKVKN
jgi:hypothetical protein